MTRISRFKLSDRVCDKLFELFFEVIARQKNKDEFNKILFDLLSPVERIMIAKRIVVIYLLMKEIDYRTICNVLKVSNGTVSKFRIIMEKSGGVVPRLKHILKEERIYLFIKELFNELFPPGRYGVNWKVAWERKFELDREKTQGI